MRVELHIVIPLRRIRGMFLSVGGYVCRLLVGRVGRFVGIQTTVEDSECLCNTLDFIFGTLINIDMKMIPIGLQISGSKLRPFSTLLPMWDHK